MYFKAFLVALTFLTRIPIPSHLLGSDVESRALSVQFYALVGLSLGILLLLATWFISMLPMQFSVELKALIVLCLWVGLTGALHLDGLADCTDAAAAAHRSAKEIQRIMQEPTLGTMAVVTLCLLLLGKFLLMRDLLQQQMYAALLVAPTLSRLIGVVYMRFTPYVGAGLAKNLTDQKYDVALFLQLLTFIVLLSVVFNMLIAGIVYLALISVLIAWRNKWLRLINGFTGDCVGAYIELAEIIVLCVLLLGASV